VKFAIIKFNFASQTHPFYCKTVVLKQTGFLKEQN